VFQGRGELRDQPPPTRTRQHTPAPELSGDRRSGAASPRGERNPPKTTLATLKNALVKPVLPICTRPNSASITPR
ncbi:hypothetical protein STRIP9103_04099, partial [Streptomyces ipomoeae 91-03]